MTGATTGGALARVTTALAAKGSRNVGGSEWTCPSHDDRAPSLTVKYGDKPGHVVIACGAGCPTDKVLAAVGLRQSDLFDLPASARRVYTYRDEDGDPLYRVVVRRNADGSKAPHQEAYKVDRWIRGPGCMTGVRRVLYRLPEIDRALWDEAPIHLTEGESDADALVEAGEYATCHPGGAGKWKDEFTDALDGVGLVLVWADRDAPGYRCAAQRLLSLIAAGIPAEGRLPIPDHAHADVRDHLAAGHTPKDGKFVTVDELLALAQAVPPEEESSDEVLAEIARLFLAGYESEPHHLPELLSDDQVQALADPEYIIDGWVPRGLYTVVYGQPGVGKTFALLGMVRAVRRGTRWQDNATRKGGVIFYQGEGLEQLKPRVRAWEARYPLRDDQSLAPGAMSAYGVDLTRPEGVAAIVRTVRAWEAANEVPVQLIVVDPLVEFMTGEENASGNDLASRGLRALAHYLNVGVVVGHHANASGERARGTEHLKMRAGAHVRMETFEDGRIGMVQEKQKNAEAQALVLTKVPVQDSLVLEQDQALLASDYYPERESVRRSHSESAKADQSDRRHREAGALLLAAITEEPGLSKTAAVERCKGKGYGTKQLEATLAALVANGLVRVEEGPRNAQQHYVTDAA